MSAPLSFPDWDNVSADGSHHASGAAGAYYFPIGAGGVNVFLQDMDLVKGTDEVGRVVRCNKTEEEIEKFAVPEDLEEWDRLSWLLQ